MAPKQNPLAVPPGMRWPITIQAKAGLPDGNGEQAWLDVLATTATVTTTSSRLGYQAMQQVAEATHVLMMAYPYRVTIASGMRVVFGQRYFAISAPPENVLERNRVLKLICVEIDGGMETE